MYWEKISKQITENKIITVLAAEIINSDEAIFLDGGRKTHPVIGILLHITTYNPDLHKEDINLTFLPGINISDLTDEENGEEDD